jgi:hypothetical protein
VATGVEYPCGCASRGKTCNNCLFLQGRIEPCVSHRDHNGVCRTCDYYEAQSDYFEFGLLYY